MNISVFLKISMIMIIISGTLLIAVPLINHASNFELAPPSAITGVKSVQSDWVLTSRAESHRIFRTDYYFYLTDSQGFEANPVTSIRVDRESYALIPDGTVVSLDSIVVGQNLLAPSKELYSYSQLIAAVRLSA